jgi:hypothetical protein
VSVSDPWEFGEAIGWRPLVGSLLKIEDDDHGGKALIMFDDVVSYGGAPWRYVVATVRHQGESITALRSGNVVLGSMIGITDEQAESTHPLDVAHWRCGLAFVGDIAPDE